MVTIPSYTVKVEEENQIHLVLGINLGSPKQQLVESVVSEQPQE